MLGLQAAAWRVPFLPTRAGLGSDMLDGDARDQDGEVAVPGAGRWRRGGARGDAGARARRRARPHEPRRPRGNGQFLGPDLYMDDLVRCSADEAHVHVAPSRSSRPTTSASTARFTRSASRRMHVDGVVEAPIGAHFTECPPDYGRDEAFQREYAATARIAEAWQEFKPASTSTCDERRVREGRSRIGEASPMSATDVTRDEICVGRDGRVLPRRRRDACATRSATIPMIGGRLARETFEPDSA